jgi:hypothetical protein
MKKLDKRSKEWKGMSTEEQEAHIALVSKLKVSKGLGDTIEKITEATGIKALVKAIFGEDCGCDERKAKLNKIFSYNRMECLVEDEYNYLKDLFTRLKNTLSTHDQAKILVIFNRVFNEKQKATQCGSCWKGIMNKMRMLYNEYEKEMGDN